MDETEIVEDVATDMPMVNEPDHTANMLAMLAKIIDMLTTRPATSAEPIPTAPTTEPKEEEYE
jgi:hypothetical protein